mgnify:CR=1 FL=1
MKISVVSRTFRIHDNPFLDSDIYIIYIDNNEYGIHQKKFLNHILYYHIKDLQNHNVTPIILEKMSSINDIIQEYSESEIYVDVFYPNMNYPFPVIFTPSWTLINWRENDSNTGISRVEMIKEWFLPEALKNHRKFKEYVHSNLRELYSSDISSESDKDKIVTSKYSDYEITLENTSVSSIKENEIAEIGLDNWIIKKLKSTDFMNDKKWFKPDTVPKTSILDEIEDLPPNLKTSMLSPYIALGVLSPLTAYMFWNGEDRMGSGRDQMLFREMFHACGQMEEFWNDDFGKEYDWKKLDKRSKTWKDFINGTTEHKDFNWAMQKLNSEGWIHHLARHLIADYLTRGKLDIHWKHGMEVFKQQLVDHDKCVNRANWMGLSGTAFSAKQRSYFHYNYDHFLTRKSLKKKS